MVYEHMYYQIYKTEQISYKAITMYQKDALKINEKLRTLQ